MTFLGIEFCKFLAQSRSCSGDNDVFIFFYNPGFESKYNQNDYRFSKATSLFLVKRLKEDSKQNPMDQSNGEFDQYPIRDSYLNCNFEFQIF